jgi:predicted O-methyltransferase YrrM
MFDEIPERMARRMRYLEEADAEDRLDGTPRDKRLRQIPLETGRFLALLAANAPPGQFVEIGTSAGYSSLWISLACRAAARKLTTFEVDVRKVGLAQRTFEEAGVLDLVHLVQGDALVHLGGFQDIAFCFLDAEKELYQQCYDVVVPNLVPGGWLVADNALNHAATLQPMIDQALADSRVDALVVPIGKGELLCRKK